MALAHGNDVHRLAFGITKTTGYLLVIEHDLAAEFDDEQKDSGNCLRPQLAKLMRSKRKCHE